MVYWYGEADKSLSGIELHPSRLPSGILLIETIWYVNRICWTRLMSQAEEHPFDLHVLMKTSILPADLSCGLYEVKESIKYKLELLVLSNAIASDF